MERKSYNNSASSVKGIYYEPKRKTKWRSTKKIGNKIFHIGYFLTERDAIEAQNKLSHQQ